jgi:hypothetical protein
MEEWVRRFGASLPMRVGMKKQTFRSNKETDEEKKAALLCLNFLTKKAPYKGLGADSEEKREPASDIDTVVVDSLKVLDPERPIREADMRPPISRANADRCMPVHLFMQGLWREA